MKYCEARRDPLPHGQELANLLQTLCGTTDMFHELTWPQVSFVAEDHKGRIVGYILAKMCVTERACKVLPGLPVQLTCCGRTPNRDEEPTEESHGHVTSISVLRNYRRLGLANKLMQLSRTGLLPRALHRVDWSGSRRLSSSRFPTEQAMRTTYNAAYVSLHVRETNRAALGLYKDTLGFKVIKIEKSYCMSTRLSVDSIKRGRSRQADSTVDRRRRWRGQPLPDSAR